MNEKIKDFYEDYQAWIMVLLIFGTFSVMSLLRAPDSGVVGRGYNRSVTGCIVEYSSTRCVDGDMVTVFHNPNEVPVNDVKMVVPEENGGTNIYKPGAPLPVNETSFLVTGGCKGQEEGNTELSYCCKGSCTRIPMKNPSDELSLEEVNYD